MARVKKWIINDGTLVLGIVEFHRDLAKNHKLTFGGGMWHYDTTSYTLYLYGQSMDFGGATKQNVINAKKECMIRCSRDKIVYANEVNIAFSDKLDLDEAVLFCELIQKI